jgi:hypothetical protein
MDKDLDFDRIMSAIYDSKITRAKNIVIVDSKGEIFCNTQSRFWINYPSIDWTSYGTKRCKHE